MNAPAPDPTAGTVTCNRCGRYNPIGLRRCATCGHKLQWTCLTCGRINSKAERVCACGARRPVYSSRERRRRQIALAAFVAGGLVAGVFVGHYVGLWWAMHQTAPAAGGGVGIGAALDDLASFVAGLFGAARDTYLAHRHLAWSVVIAVSLSLVLYAVFYPPWWTRKLRWKLRRRLRGSLPGQASTPSRQG